MAKATQYRSSILASIYETADGLNADGLINRQMLREFDELCLTTAIEFDRPSPSREP